MSSKHMVIEWEKDALQLIAEEIRIAITCGRPVSLEKYVRLATAKPAGEIGFSFVWITKNEKRMGEFIPDEIISILSFKMKRSRFDEHADSFIRTRRDLTAKQIGDLFFMGRETVALRAEKLGVKLKKERRRFSPGEDRIIRKYFKIDIGIAAKLIGVPRSSVSDRARFLGMHVPKIRFSEWSEEQLKTLRESVEAGKNDQEISDLLKNRSRRSVAKKRQKMGRLKRKFFKWRLHPDKLEYLVANYKTMTYEQIAKKLGLTRKQVATKAEREGLEKCPKTEQKAP